MHGNRREMCRWRVASTSNRVGNHPPQWAPSVLRRRKQAKGGKTKEIGVQQANRIVWVGSEKRDARKTVVGTLGKERKVQR